MVYLFNFIPPSKTLPGLSSRLVYLSTIIMTVGQILLVMNTSAQSTEIILPLSLRQGWNFFSLPITPTTTSIDDFFQHQNAGDPWVYNPGASQYLPAANLEAGRGYWIYMNANANLAYTGQAADLPISAPGVGWNVIAPYSQKSRPENALGSIWRFERGRFITVAGALLPGSSYWVNLSNNNPINPGSTAIDLNNNNIPDFWEEIWKLIKAAHEDDDEDGLPNLAEFQHGTNPMTGDSDNDGLTDPDEVNTHGTNPRRHDSDRDGLNDEREINLHQTNPTKADHDGDGTNDGDEVAEGSDPRDANSVPPGRSIVFLKQPGNTVSNSPLAPLSVAMLNKFGRVVKNTNAAVTISLLGGTGLEGTLTKSMTNGIATFNGLTIDQTGSYKLIADIAAFPLLISESFDILNASQTFVSGQISEANGNDIAGAEVSIDGVLAGTSDGAGVFAFPLTSLPTDQKINLTVTAPGYATSHKVVTIIPDATVSLNIILNQVNAVLEQIPDNSNLVIDTPGRSACIIIPNASSTLDTTDRVCLELSYGNPKEDQDIFPGEFQARNPNQADSTIGLASIAFGEIRVTNTFTGDPITNLAGNATMELEIPPGTINPDTREPYMVGDTLEIWNYSESAGEWVRAVDDSGTPIDADVISRDINGVTKLIAQFQIPHFSWWQVAVPIETRHCLTGRVTNATGSPVAFAQVIATGIDYNGVTVAHTDPQGSYCLEVRRGSVIRLQARKGGRETAPAQINVPNAESSCDLSINNDCTAVDDLQLPASSCIAGVVRDNNDIPLANAFVEIFNIPGKTIITSTDANGAYCLEDVPLDLGTVGLRAFVIDEGRFAFSIASLSVDLTSRSCADEDCLSQDFAIELDFACVSGTIADHNSTGLASAFVWLGDGTFTTTDGSGNYCLIAPLDRDVTLHASYYDPASGIIHQAANTFHTAASAGTCPTDNCQTVDLSIDLQSFGCIHGTVKSENDINLPGVVIAVPGFPATTSDANGNYCLEARIHNNLPVKFTYFLPTGRKVQQVVSTAITSAGECSDDTTCVTLNQTLTLGIGCISGAIKRNNSALTGMQVIASNGATTLTDAGGNFCLEVESGNYVTDPLSLSFFKLFANGEILSFNRTIANVIGAGTCLNTNNCLALPEINIANRAPRILQITANPTTTISARTVTVRAVAVDPDGDSLAYHWFTAGGTITGTGNTITWTAPQVNSTRNIPIFVRISDGHNSPVSGSVTVTVIPEPPINHAPIIQSLTSPVSSLPPNGTTAISVRAQDPNGDPVTIAWLASAGSINGAGTLVNWTAPATPGDHVITVTVSDGSLSASSSLTLSVSTNPSGPMTVKVVEENFPLIPVANARVLLHNANGTINQEVVSNANGVVSFSAGVTPPLTVTALRRQLPDPDSNSNQGNSGGNTNGGGSGDPIIYAFFEQPQNLANRHASWEGEDAIGGEIRDDDTGQNRYARLKTQLPNLGNSGQFIGIMDLPGFGPGENAGPFIGLSAHNLIGATLSARLRIAPGSPTVSARFLVGDANQMTGGGSGPGEGSGGALEYATSFYSIPANGEWITITKNNLQVSDLTFRNGATLPVFSGNAIFYSLEFFAANNNAPKSVNIDVDDIKIEVNSGPTLIESFNPPLPLGPVIATFEQDRWIAATISAAPPGNLIIPIGGGMGSGDGSGARDDVVARVDLVVQNVPAETTFITVGPGSPQNPTINGTTWIYSNVFVDGFDANPNDNFVTVNLTVFAYRLPASGSGNEPNVPFKAGVVVDRVVTINPKPTIIVNLNRDMSSADFTVANGDLVDVVELGLDRNAGELFAGIKYKLQTPVSSGSIPFLDLNPAASGTYFYDAFIEEQDDDISREFGEFKRLGAVMPQNFVVTMPAFFVDDIIPNTNAQNHLISISLNQNSVISGANVMSVDIEHVMTTGEKRIAWTLFMPPRTTIGFPQLPADIGAMILPDEESEDQPVLFIDMQKFSAAADYPALMSQIQALLTADVGLNELERHFRLGDSQFSGFIIGDEQGGVNFSLDFIFSWQHMPITQTNSTTFSGNPTYPAPIAYYFALFHVNNNSGNFPASVTFNGPSGSGLNNTVSANKFGQSYASPQIYLPPSGLSPTGNPVAGNYVVDFNGQNQIFNKPDPQLAARQIFLLPTFEVQGGNLQKITWAHRKSDGNPPQSAETSFIQKIEVRIQFNNGSNQYNSPNPINPGVSEHVPNQTISWSTVALVQMVLYDSNNNQFTTYWFR